MKIGLHCIKSVFNLKAFISHTGKLCTMTLLRVLQAKLDDMINVKLKLVATKFPPAFILKHLTEA